MKPIICHITSVHPANDIRIFHKECASLAKHGYEVHLVAQGTLPTDTKGVIHHPLPIPTRESRIGRMIFRAYQAYRIAKQTHATVFHFHDPELLPYGLLLKWQGKTVIYDAHEDLPRDIMTKKWIPHYLRKTIAIIVEKTEHFIARRLDATITATPFINKRFEAIGAKATDIKNYPQLSEFAHQADNTHSKAPKDKAICYVGMISNERGMVEMIQVAEKLDIRLIIAGPFMNQQTEAQARALPGWKKVDYRGTVSRQEIAAIFAESSAGLCLLHPLPTYQDSLPIKLFEYMAAGLPVLTSHFPLWKGIVENAQCGFCVDPLNGIQIEQGMQRILQNPAEAHTMGQQGRAAVLQLYSWEAEVERLVGVYQRMMMQLELEDVIR
jgi:hypothetical protein